MRRTLAMVLMLALGIAGKTVWDVVFAPSPAAAAVPVEPRPAAGLLAPLPQPVKRVKPMKVKARRSVTAPVAAPLAPIASPLPDVKEEEQPEVPWLAPPLVTTDREEEELEPPLALDDGNGEAIARMIARTKRQAVQQCFERELKRTPDLAGRVTVHLELAPPSRVASVRVNDDLQRPEFSACLLATMQRLAFTGLNEEVTIQLPYTLSAVRK